MTAGQPGAGTAASPWVLPAGSTARDGWDVVVDDRRPGWAHTALHVATIPAGGSLALDADHAWERVVVPLAGGLRVQTDSGDEAALAGRTDVLAGPTDVAYCPPGTGLRLEAGDGPVRVAVCGARVEPGARAHPFRRLEAGEVPVELRGAGAASRQVHPFAMPGVLPAQQLLACEVLTPAGCWSSWPAHRHDTDVPGEQTALEEIYYVEARPAGGTRAAGADPYGLLQVSASDERPVDVLTQVRTGDVVLVPYGWHGPAAAPPGYDLYYLNVMAGPGRERAWLIEDHPAYAHVRDGWADQAVDPRLPFGGHPGVRGTAGGGR